MILVCRKRNHASGASRDTQQRDVSPSHQRLVRDKKDSMLLNHRPPHLYLNPWPAELIPENNN